jgi:serine protease Do
MNERLFSGTGRRRLLRLAAYPLAFGLGVAPALAGQTHPAPPSPAAASCRTSIPDLFDQVSPAVVAIDAMSVKLYDPEERADRVSGSGVLIDPSGLILTNSHVVFGRQAISVTLDDGATLQATIVGTDPIYDIALIRIEPPKSVSLPLAHLGDSSTLRVGQEIYAIGNPFGLDQTLTRGVVSAVNRQLGDTWTLTEPLIQTDAAINPGNSGGPIVDGCGSVVGITTASFPEAQSIGFAVPSNLIKQVMPSLISKGKIVRPWLGVEGQIVPSTLEDLLRTPLHDGFLVEAVEPGSPAETAGLSGGHLDLTVNGSPYLVGGDIITSLDDVTVNDADDLEQALGALKVGASLRLTVFRDGKIRRIDVVVTERPFLPGDAATCNEDVLLHGARGSGSRMHRTHRRAF